MNYSSISQVALLIIAIAMVFTYIKPTFVEIKTMQDELFEYTDAKNKADEFNVTLESLLAELASFNPSDVKALETYVPASIDSVAVMADIEQIAKKNNMAVSSLKADAVEEGNPDVVLDGAAVGGGGTFSQDIDVTVSGSYEDVKDMLKDFEKNKYILEVVKFSFGAISDTATAVVSSSATPKGSYTFTLRTYGLTHTVMTDEGAVTSNE